MSLKYTVETKTLTAGKLEIRYDEAEGQDICSIACITHGIDGVIQALFLDNNFTATDILAQRENFLLDLKKHANNISQIIIPKLYDTCFADMFSTNWHLGLPKWYVDFVYKYFKWAL